MKICRFGFKFTTAGRYRSAAFSIGPLTDPRWVPRGLRIPEASNIAIQVTPPDGEEDDEFVPTLRMRRKLSTPLSAMPGVTDGLINLPNLRASPSRSLSPLDRTKRRFSTMVSSSTAAAVSRRLSATIGWCLASPTQVKPQIVRQGRALCLQYIKTQIRRSTLCEKKTECGEEAVSNSESGVLVGLRALCAALERKRPDAFRQVARQATRAPSAMLRSDTALAELALALARRITRENITWSKNGLVERLLASERDQRSEKNLRVLVSFFVIACISLLLFRWVLHAHPAYND
ncbi:unnamed protein product [Spodoptera littoralis]|uniref:Uncharacterized protein n=1 Tax=Spodoptera littoralis TaxID=7109 RepID=A0A9P0IBJ8_SPOLI|nr:unnamed protein product [Spodoptera littoralis]CAH1644932.1 unnamed protein product [Spodoptera littoralis]